MNLTPEERRIGKENFDAVVGTTRRDFLKGSALAAVVSGTSPTWNDVLTTGVSLSRTVSGLHGGTVYRWRVRLLYRPGNRLGQAASRWLYLPWNGPQEADFRTLSVLAPTQHHFFLPMILRIPSNMIGHQTVAETHYISTHR